MMGTCETTPIQATSYNDEYIVIAAPERDYYMYKDKKKFMRPTQETCSFASAELVC